MTPTSRNPIRRLDPLLIDQIAAGEVIEGPHSVVKELIENSLDAGATHLTIEWRSGGADYILIEDDGHGIPAEEMTMTIERHATSKIVKLDDLHQLLSFGFRGEALASIASISHIELESRTAAADLGARIEARGGAVVDQSGAARHRLGTRVVVRELFYATPARRKFLKTPRTENSRIQKVIERAALASPQVAFSIFRDGKRWLELKSGNLSARIGALFGNDLRLALLPIETSAAAEGIYLSGYISALSYVRSNRELHYDFVNGRPIELRHGAFHVRAAYEERLPSGSFPFSLLSLVIDPERLDVNVHPGKREVRFADESLLPSLIRSAVRNALYERSAALGIDSPDKRFVGSAPDHYQYHYPIDLYSGEQQRNSGHNDQAAVTASEGVASSASINPSGATPYIATPARPFREIELRLLSVVHGTYIVAESNDGNLYLIDQHAAHERVNYERIHRRIAADAATSQPLLVPIALHLPPHRLEALLERRQQIAKHGFEVEPLSANSCAIRSVPAWLPEGSERELFEQLIQRLTDDDCDEEQFRDYAASKACKASIRRNDAVPHRQLEEILRQLRDCDEPERCPHGRPTLLQLRRHDLDRMFHRS